MFLTVFRQYGFSNITFLTIFGQYVFSYITFLIIFRQYVFGHIIFLIIFRHYVYLSIIFKNCCFSIKTNVHHCTRVTCLEKKTIVLLISFMNQRRRSQLE